jgi:hypothetical protein
MLTPAGTSFLNSRKLYGVTISFESRKGNPDLPWITPEIETTDRVVIKSRLFPAEWSATGGLLKSAILQANTLISLAAPLFRRLPARHPDQRQSPKDRWQLSQIFNCRQQPPECSTSR